MIETGKKFYVAEYYESGKEYTIYTVKKIYTEKQKEYVDFEVYTLENNFNAINPKTGKFLAISEYLKYAKPDLVKATVKETSYGITIKSGRSIVAKASDYIAMIDTFTIIE